MRFVIAAVALLWASAAPAAGMSVADFLTKADALEQRGVTALFSSDYSLLKAEVKGAGEGLRRDQKAARAAGKRPATCLPENKVPLDSNELLAYFRSIPAPQRNITVAAAFTNLMKRKYPCPAGTSAGTAGLRYGLAFQHGSDFGGIDRPAE
jgi:hypothetical protein